MTRKMRYAGRHKSNTYNREESGIFVFFSSINECRGNRLSWLGPKKYSNTHYMISGDAKKEVVDALINEIYFTNVKVKSQGNMEEDLGNCIEIMKRGAILDGGIYFFKTGDHEDERSYDSATTGCCCGMEDAMNILSGMLRHKSPWMGHDPWTKMKERNGFFYICYGDFPMVTYEKNEFRRYIKKAADGYMQFVEGPMTNRLKGLLPEKADEFIEAFKHAFGAFHLTKEDYEFFDTYVPDEHDEEDMPGGPLEEFVDDEEFFDNDGSFDEYCEND